jgi:hypothetical protein
LLFRIRSTSVSPFGITEGFLPTAPFQKLKHPAATQVPPNSGPERLVGITRRAFLGHQDMNA